MSPDTIDIRYHSDQGPAILGELIASCPIVRFVGDYQHPAIDIQLPEGFVFPDEPTTIALYFGDNQAYGGSLILDKDGFRPHPEYTPYFTMKLLR